jgi:hypothetical protein
MALDFDTDRLWAFVADALRAGMPTFRRLVSRSAKSQLYFQNVQFAHQVEAVPASATTVPSTQNEGIGPDEWVQANFYQAILTMKMALLMEMNPRPVVRPAGVSVTAGKYSWSLPIRQAIDAIHREIDLDRVIFEELHNLLLFGSSFRFTYVKQRPVEEMECPICQIPVSRDVMACPGCGIELPFHDDGELAVEVVPPMRVFLYPHTADSIGEVALLAWVDFVPRHRAIERLTTIWKLPLENIEPALERVYLTCSEEMLEGEEEPEQRNLPEIKELQQTVRRFIDICGDINTIGRRFGAGGGKVPSFPITSVLIRRGTLMGLQCDVALHFVEDRFIGATEVDFDMMVEMFINRRVPGRIYGDGEEALINQQDALNNLLTISYISALSRSFSVIAGDPTRANLDDVPRFPNSLVIDVATGPEQSVKNALEIVPGTPITPDVPALRDSILTNMQILAQVFPVLFGNLPAGVEAYKAIEVLRSQSLRAMRPIVASWCAAHKRWLSKALTLASRTWRYPRVTSAGGYIFYVDGNMIGDGAASVRLELDPNMVFPTGEQDRRTLIIQGIQTGLIDPKRDEISRLRTVSELGIDMLEDELINEIERQKHEINTMISTRKFAIIDPYDQHVLHYRVVLQFLRSEYGRYLKETQPDVYRLIESHGKIHGFMAVKDYERAAVEMSAVGIREWMMEKARFVDADELTKKLKEITPELLGMFAAQERAEMAGAGGQAAAVSEQALQAMMTQPQTPETAEATPAAAPGGELVSPLDILSALGQ